MKINRREAKIQERKRKKDGGKHKKERVDERSN